MKRPKAPKARQLFEGFGNQNSSAAQRRYVERELVRLAEEEGGLSLTEMYRQGVAIRGHIADAIFGHGVASSQDNAKAGTYMTDVPVPMAMIDGQEIEIGELPIVVEAIPWKDKDDREWTTETEISFKSLKRRRVESLGSNRSDDLRIPRFEVVRKHIQFDKGTKRATLTMCDAWLVLKTGGEYVRNVSGKAPQEYLWRYREIPFNAPAEDKPKRRARKPQPADEQQSTV